MEEEETSPPPPHHHHLQLVIEQEKSLGKGGLVRYVFDMDDIMKSRKSWNNIHNPFASFL